MPELNDYEEDDEEEDAEKWSEVDFEVVEIQTCVDKRVEIFCWSQ